MGYQTMSILEAINKISTKQMYLPEIQRNFVWKENQIENLFDSIILGYPIGTFLFWKTTKAYINQTEQNIYNFICDYHERDAKTNSKEELPLLVDYENVYIVLDGQQRLSALYMALKGSIAYKMPKSWWRMDDAFPRKELYFDLDTDLAKKTTDDIVVQRFKFFKENSLPKNSSWFKVRSIFNFSDIGSLVSFAIECGLTKNQTNNLTKLYSCLNDKSGNSVINYYEIEEVQYDDVLSIFVRVNSSGTPLSKTDLLFSTIVSEWKGGRKEIEGLIKQMNKKGEFNFSVDFVMRGCLTLTDSPINLKIESFKKTNIQLVSHQWSKIKKAFLDLVEFLRKIGFNGEYITAYNALLPILYFLYRGGELSDDNIQGFKRFFIVAQIKSLFGVASNAAISDTRKVLQNINCSKTVFSLDIFKDVRLVGDRTFTVDESVIDMVFDYDIGSYTYMVLTLLYPELKYETVKFHQDHIHPYTGFDYNKIKKLGISRDTIALWQKMRNRLPNLQFLPGNENESKNKTPLSEWLAKGNCAPKFLPEEISYNLINFADFYEKRMILMRAKLREVLGITNNADEIIAEQTVAQNPTQNDPIIAVSAINETHEVGENKNAVASINNEENLRRELYQYQGASEYSVGLFLTLDKQIMKFSHDVVRHLEKNYVGYKVAKNFVRVKLRKEKLLVIFPNCHIEDLDDVKHICEDITLTERMDYANVAFEIASFEEMDYALSLIKQAYLH